MKGLFEGTAEYYVRYRLPYPRSLLDDLLARAAVGGQGRLLDLGCGPGRLTFALAPRFSEVMAVDYETDMIEMAQRQAALKGVAHVTWAIGKAEEFAAPDSSFDMVTFGEAFHRLDQVTVAGKAFRWLRPSGSLAILGSYGILSAIEPWQVAVMEVIRRWLPPLNANAFLPVKPNTDQMPGNNERVLRDAGFIEVASYTFHEPHTWTVDEVAGLLFSTSICSKKALGPSAEPFEADLRASLLSLDPSGIYRETMQWGYTFGRKGSSPA